ncbi:hypothetical protein [Streptomyces caelestis]|uniref:hypothetical protein n=1 Tax=Streptomyces caelestis TaxID=36816 RepID=UPI003664B33E
MSRSGRRTGPDAGCPVRERAGEDAPGVVHVPPRHTAERPEPQVPGPATATP